MDGGHERMEVEGGSWRKVQGGREGGGGGRVGMCGMMEIMNGKALQLEPSTWSNEYCKAKTRNLESLSSQHISG